MEFLFPPFCLKKSDWKAERGESWGGGEEARSGVDNSQLLPSMGDRLPEQTPRAANPSPAVAACSEAEAIEVLETEEDVLPMATEDVSCI